MNKNEKEIEKDVCDCGEHCDCGSHCDCGDHCDCETENPIAALLDPENENNIILYDENDKAVEFEQIAIIPIDNDIYAILRPVEQMEGTDEDVAIVFELSEDEEGNDVIEVVDNSEVVDKVYEKYMSLIGDGEDAE